MVLKIFEDSTFHGKLGKNYSKSLPQNMFKTCLETFGNTFGHFWNFENIFLLKIFENSTLQGTLGKKFFRKIFPKTCSKHVWILLRTLLGIFGTLKIFFLENFRKLDPPRNTGQKKISKNLTQNKFKTRLDIFGNDFGPFWNFEKKIENFRKLDPPWNTGHKFFSRKSH